MPHAAGRPLRTAGTPRHTPPSVGFDQPFQREAVLPQNAAWRRGTFFSRHGLQVLPREPEAMPPRSAHGGTVNVTDIRASSEKVPAAARRSRRHSSSANFNASRLAEAPYRMDIRGEQCA